MIFILIGTMILLKFYVLQHIRGNKLLWDYDPSQDEEIYEAYRAIRNAGVTIFDTADSYGEHQHQNKVFTIYFLVCSPYIVTNPRLY